MMCICWAWLVRLACLLACSLPLSASRVTVKKKDIQKNKTQPAAAASSMPDNPLSQPTTKYWGKAEKVSLTSFVNTSNVHIFNSSFKNIKTVRREHFPHREPKNFRSNFRNFAAAWALESEYTGARLGEEAGGKSAHLYLSYYSTLANIPPSPPLVEPQTAKGATSPTTMPTPTKLPVHTKPHPKK
jgi:hypothetical protein